MNARKKPVDKVSSNLEQEKNVPSSVPSLPSELGTKTVELGTDFTDGISSRMLKARQHLKFTQLVFSKSIGVHQNSICRYENGDRIPDVETVARISIIHGFSLQWLMIGEGPMRPGSPTPDGSAPGSSGPALNVALLQSVLIAVRQATAAAGRTLTPAQEAQLITGVYELCRTLPPGSPIASSAILPFLSAIK